ncbi:PadR family transcriptional regulator PadR [Parabacteroides sp. PFB2-12]|uniref:PadR family transcriptional regulator n=1 Tax=unclassified Parabacteroides TaxID=2649774 RepID=UPI0024769187|nr:MULTISPECIES: PadR family transcriptional regulator [unclassified Parabacteroides]MDH6342151.1 PadR family transcriptional regulator PadR [Parabacteroides sp. PM6-13]MDH6389570.1 PadR family transcriptional regulator PadR [Parabacteroides sp. PFB2-12]
MNEEFLHKWQSQVKKGTLAFILLNLLKDKEMYGYEIIDQISRQVAIDIAEGTLYPLLNRLKTDGLVDSKWVEQQSGIPRKYYTLTLTGKATLDEMSEFWNSLDKSIKKISK